MCINFYFKITSKTISDKYETNPSYKVYLKIFQFKSYETVTFKKHPVYLYIFQRKVFLEYNVKKLDGIKERIVLNS